MNRKIGTRPDPAKKPEADNWDGPYYRPFYSQDYVHREWWPDHSLALDALQPAGCWIYTLSGYAIYRCGNQRRVLEPGIVLAYRSPDRGRLSLDRAGLPWHSINIQVTGAPALEMFDFVVNQFGMFHTLPAGCSAVEHARKIARLVEKQPRRSPHVWSQHTFTFLNSWWECAQKSCGSVSSILHESPHSSRLIGLGARNVKSLAEQLGFSRSHLSRKLKWQWDKPPGAVLRRVRMEEAAKLLRTSNLNISMIAVKLGFSAPSALTRAFKKHYGMGPLSYRSSHGSGLGGKKRATAQG